MTKATVEQAEYRGEALAARSAIGGIFMGLANLVPGISGGTMLLAAGVYPQFINGIAEVSTLKFRPKTLLTLACIVGAALLAILGFAGLVGELVVHHRWIMYSIFIGLTLGGVPVLWRMIEPADSTIVLASIVGIAIMAVMALVGPVSASTPSSPDRHAYAMYFLAGLAGASAMVLPGISGGYLLLVLGQYVTVLTAVAAVTEGLQARDWGRIANAMHVIVPVGVGVLVGAVGVSNLIKILLEKHPRPTLGLLLGLLLGAVVGLWPYQHGVAPQEGDSFRGDTVVLINQRPAMQSTGKIIHPKEFETAMFTPTVWQIGGAIVFMAAGFALSTAVAHLGRGKSRR